MIILEHFSWDYLSAFGLSFVLSILFTLIVKEIAWRFNIVDVPNKRKIHQQNTPLLGGVAVFLSFFIVLFLNLDKFFLGNLQGSHLWGFFLGALLIMIGGSLDDKYNFSPRKQITFSLLAVLVVILGGVQIEKITNPWGGLWQLNQFVILGPALIIIWLLGMMYTTKLLDGVDGLVSGMGVIGGFIIFLFTLTSRYYQPDIAFLALILAGAGLGFLVFNFYPAKIFLGEGGSLFFGYSLGVLAIISGGKIAIALLIMGLPILDLIWTIIRRILAGKNPFKFADKKHLHHRLLALGLSSRQTALVFYIFALIFGLSGLFLQSQGKFLALLGLVLIMLIFILWLNMWENKQLSGLTQQKSSSHNKKLKNSKNK